MASVMEIVRSYGNLHVSVRTIILEKVFYCDGRWLKIFYFKILFPLILLEL